MEQRLKYQINFKWHAVSWIFVTTYLCLLDPVIASLTGQVVVTFFIMINYMFIFYFSAVYLFPRFWRRKRIMMFPLLAVAFFLFSFFDYLNICYVLTAFTGKNLYAKHLQNFVQEIIWPNLFAFVLPTVAALAYFLHNLNLAEVKINGEKERAILAAEVKFLKNQFNSHITFNFLNYCYSNVHEISEKTADAIDLFSSMLRYSLRVKPDEKVPIEQEIEYINNFIKLQKLLTSKVNVDFVCQGDRKNKVILSRLLITFVENAFKHGRINSTSRPIKILLHCESDFVSLTVTNEKVNRGIVNGFDSGVGHENVLRILDLFYANSYDLKIEQDSEIYKCNLNLRLAS